MNGNDRYVLDTNAIVTLLRGDYRLVELLSNASWIGISIISQIEFLAFSDLSQDDRNLFRQFLQRIDVVGLTVGDEVLVEKIVEIRQQYRLKLPDAIIAAIAIQNTASLVTADKEFTKVPILSMTQW
ncbi:MAG: PIN domain-containing protein [Elainellaceae cyanobacterium]